ncbi:CidA/LrgA family protein [Janibacter cremeus]|uniref:Holin-like protein n=1 Tax=Janibacter cremeus TaxID=1285192 RepID=A0A852VTI0_9MICO|nr:CidA/LrgA family protein [Janibacter cremeus]NYF99299.1 holin-like protein [Janibacter cremeus]
MINGALWVLGCQLVGEVVARWLDLPVPGPVLGMVLLFGVLSVRRPGQQSGTLRVADGLLRHLQLLFVPVTVGIMVHAGTIRQEWLPVTGGLVLSWAAGLVTVAGLATLLVRRRGAADESLSGESS